jgi:hypothetical protein
MATQDDVRRIALSLPHTSEDAHGFRFFVRGRQFVWAWMERVDPKRARVANPDVVAVRVANELEKQTVLAMDPDVFFTEPHYDGYPAVLVRLPRIELPLLERIVADGWRTRA